MQTLAASLAQEPLDPIFALASSSVPSALKIILIIILSIVLLACPFIILVRFLQDSSIALGRHSPDNRIPHWVALTPLLLVATISAIYFYMRAANMLPSSPSRAQWRVYVSALCPCVESSAIAVSLVAAMLKLQVPSPALVLNPTPHNSLLAARIRFFFFYNRCRVLQHHGDGWTFSARTSPPLLPASSWAP